MNVANGLELIHLRGERAVKIEDFYLCFGMMALKKIGGAALLMALLLGSRLQAQTLGFGLSVTTSTNLVTINDSLTYTIYLTNQTQNILDYTFISNTLPSSVQFLSYSNNPSFVTSDGNTIIFEIDQFYIGSSVQVFLTVQPTAAGSITNLIDVIGYSTPFTASTNAVTQVIAGRSDLAVTMSGPASAVYPGDLMNYGVTATNLGPDDAPGVILTNTLPAGVLYKSVSPASPAPTISGSNFIFNLGTLASDSGQSFQLTVQATNSGNLNFTASVGAAGIIDPDTTNNFASTNILVSNYLPAQLVAVTNSPQIYNMQDNLVEQHILLSNEGTNSVPAVRLFVLGLTKTNALFNAVATNSGNPYVIYASSLDAGQSVNLLLQFAAKNYFPFGNAQLEAFAVMPPDLTAPPQTSASTNGNIVSVTKLSSSSTLIWFRSVSNRTYTVAYTSDLSSTNWTVAQPSVVAPTTFTEWIDYGPPETLSHPTNVSMRFYRVFQNP